MNKTKLNFILLIVLILICFLSSLLIGLNFQNFSLEHQILLELRLPHIINTFVIGGLLGLSGCLMQVMLENPLADPFILGISGGASTGTLFGYFLGFTGNTLLSFSFLGAVIAMGLLITITGHMGRASSGKIIISGVILAAGWGAVMSLLLTLLPSTQLKGVMFWLFGDLDNPLSYLSLFILCAGALVSFTLSHQLDILNQGTLLAQTLGVNIENLRIQLFFLTCILTATAVSLSGIIGFLGLIVPHLTRFLFAHHHKIIIPGSILLGANLLIAADFFANHIIYPEQIPVGIMTTLLGVIVFLYLSKRKYG